MMRVIISCPNEDPEKINEFLSFHFNKNREDMEKVNVNFYDNYTVSYQHKKILQFVPELSVDPNTRITVPNIPLLVSSSFIINYLVFYQNFLISHNRHSRRRVSHWVIYYLERYQLC